MKFSRVSIAGDPTKNYTHTHKSIDLGLGGVPKQTTSLSKGCGKILKIPQNTPEPNHQIWTWKFPELTFQICKYLNQADQLPKPMMTRSTPPLEVFSAMPSGGDGIGEQKESVSEDFFLLLGITQDVSTPPFKGKNVLKSQHVFFVFFLGEGGVDPFTTDPCNR